MTRPPTLLLASLVVAAFAGCGDDTHEQEAGASATATATPEDTGWEQGTGCEPVEKPAPREVDLPSAQERLGHATTYVATVTTNPQGNGSGGTGYPVVEAPPANLTYAKGVVAMAKTAIEEPGTSGSQFFVVTGDDTELPPECALVGKVTAGQEVVDLIGVAPVGPDEQPVEPIVMRSVEVSER